MKNVVTLKEAIKLEEEGYPQGKSKYKYFAKGTQHGIIKQGYKVAGNSVKYYDAPSVDYIPNLKDKINSIGKIANNALYFADNSDCKNALYEILKITIEEN